MRTFRDAKTMAKALRQGLAERHIDLSHSDCLELVAKQFGFPDWNVLAVRIGGQQTLKLPEGWVTTGSNSDRYEMGIDDSLPKGTALIRSKDAGGSTDGGFGTLMQSFAAAEFRGQRVRLSAELKAEDVTGAATLWFRVDGLHGKLLTFDNMEKRVADGVLMGTTDWNRRDIVLDVPDEADSLHFGFYLRGGGTAYARGFELSQVDDTVAITVPMPPVRPVNLDFA